jgi:hypothetical protein
MTGRDKFPGWSLVEDGYLDEPEPVVPEPRRSGCAFWPAIAILLLVLVASSVPTSSEARTLAASPAESGLRGVPVLEPASLAGVMVGSSAVGSDAPYPEPTLLPATGTPQPSGAIGTALIGGWASWFDVGPGYYAAAGPLLREALGDWRGQYVTVEGDGASVTVQLSDWCACGSRHGVPTIIDLSWDAFAELADPALGIVRVSIEIDPAEHPDDRRMRLEDFQLPATDAAR